MTRDLFDIVVFLGMLLAAWLFSRATPPVSS